MGFVSNKQMLPALHRVTNRLLARIILKYRDSQTLTWEARGGQYEQRKKTRSIYGMPYI